VIVAEDLAPSDTANLSLELVKGFITEKGGITSHVSIMARSLGIPALVGVSGILQTVKPGMLIAMNAQSGQVILDPDEATQALFAEKQKAFEIRMKQLEETSTLPAVTTDGHKVKVYANVGSVQDIRNALPYHVNGIGLFRSEFLFMESNHFPTEEEQFSTYKEAILTLGHEIIVRTLDIGGDKGLSYFEFPVEENPFLGYRAIRLCLDRTDVFKTQLRAILRASQFGPLRIMIPMIISVEELEAAKAIIQTCKDELTAEGLAFDEKIQVGIMIETPAAVLMAPDLASRCDFFSIGTNDLTQYILAVDRGNQRISHLYDSCNPAVLRAVKQVIDAGHAAGIEVGMCGEFASDLTVTEFLLGLGLDEFSMAAGETPIVKEKIRTLSYAESQKKTRKIIAASSTAQVHELLESEQV
jgi:phosphotransferase system enzyme I (PtsI)